jgi:tetratricopeptide (TPR) repeat protein
MTAYGYDLGGYHRAITTAVPEAQLWFDRGMVWCYAYNHEEAVRCFERAAAADPDCAIAWWGVAYAAGPNYNKQWKAFDPVDLESSLDTAWRATEKALALRDRASAVERALIEPLAERYRSSNPADVTPVWNDGYAAAMRLVYREHPDDHDIAALFAEAIMNRTPWQLWETRTGKPAEGADTAEAIDVLERGLAQPGGMDHPGLLHMYVHLMEMSPHPERALRAADRLRTAVPDAGHLVHMPTHIDVLCGLYKNVCDWNERAVAADRKYVKREGARNFYSLYRAHNYHFIVYGAMFLGQYKTAIEAAERMVENLPEELLRVESPPMADWLEGFVPMKQHVLIRFGKWEEIVGQELPADTVLYSTTTAMIHYAKAVAHAALSDIGEAEREAERFEVAMAAVQPTRGVFNNTCLDILAVAAEMMKGEIAYRKGEFDAAFAHLRKSVELDDSLPYDEPWGWMQPTRHALGALLLEQERVEEAEAVYRADLGLDRTIPRACLHPENVWSLHGFHECLMRLGKFTEANLIKGRLDLALAWADVPIKSSCFCRLRQAA